jgi:hypothetical protein
MVDKKSKIIEEIFQSYVIKWLLMTIVIIRESLSKVTEESFRDKDSWAARRVAGASL